tara:strand:- start:21461 stop:21655 length:195 start_codon:yes stop_codon:yes gene_type:complete
MNKYAHEWLAFFMLILMTIAAFSAAEQRDELKVQAVKRGFAEWVCDVNGQTTFKWKNQPQTQPQ